MKKKKNRKKFLLFSDLDEREKIDNCLCYLYEKFEATTKRNNVPTTTFDSTICVFRVHNLPRCLFVFCFVIVFSFICLSKKKKRKRIRRVK